MAAQFRLENYNGVTLVVRDGWITVVWDATGHTMEGPIESDDDVRKFAHIAVDALNQVSIAIRNP